MAKVKSPLFSEGALGQFAKTLTYGKNATGPIVMKYSTPAVMRTPKQAVMRTIFKNLMSYWGKMTKEEQFLWQMALDNYQEYSKSVIQYIHRTARCLFLWHCLPSGNTIFNGSPFPPSLIQMYASDQIDDFFQIFEDIETLTGLPFCEGVDPYFFPFLGNYATKDHPNFGGIVVGLSSWSGTAIALKEGYYKSVSDYEKVKVIAHELTHSLMYQHGWETKNNIPVSEAIAEGVASRVADGNLSPIYTYLGKTLSEIVPFPECE